MSRSGKISRRLFAGAAVLAAVLTFVPGVPLSSQSLSFSQDCIAFDSNAAQVRRYSSSWKLVAGTLWLRDFGDNEEQAQRALQIIQHYGLNRQCFVGRPNPSLEYYLADGRAPAGSLSGEDCTSFDPARLEIKRAGGRWKIAEADHWLLDFGNSRTEAERALEIIHAFGFTHLCWVGRPDPSFTYLRSGGAAAFESGTPSTPSRVRPQALPASIPVLIYGSSSCGRCTSMKTSLEREDIPYSFFDINRDSDRKAELWRHINREHPGTHRVSIPVVVVGEEVLINPTFEEVRQKLASTASRPAADRSTAARTGSSSWEESDYDRYDHRSFFDFAPARQRIRLDSIDYPLLQAALFFETNRVRVSNGLSPLAYHAGCASAAQMHAKDMATGKFFSHENPNDPSKRRLQDRVALFGIRWNWLAENINQGMGNGTYIEVARQYVDSWMNSSGHRANMLNVNPTHMGTGAYNAGSEHSDLYFDSVQVFAKIRR